MATFWMKDTPLPHDIMFVRADGTISTIAANAVPMSTAEIMSAEPIRADVEINGGLSIKLGIAPGDRVRASIFAGAKPHCSCVCFFCFFQFLSLFLFCC